MTAHCKRAPEAGARIVGGSKSTRLAPRPAVIAADTLVGNKVFNRQGEKLGKIEHIMLDVPAGRVAYVVVEAGSYLGVGSKFFAIPWSKLNLATDKECFVLDMNREQLTLEPAFDKSNWLTL